MARSLGQLTMMRPQSQNPDMPQWAPERDVVAVAAGMIEDMRVAFQVGRFDVWRHVLEWMLKIDQEPEETRKAMVDAAVNDAGRRFAAYVRAAQLNSRELTIPEQTTALVKDFKTATEEFINPNPTAAFFVSAMLGFMFMDRFFFCTRQAFLVGEESGLPTDQFLSLVSRIGNGWRCGEVDNDIAARELKLTIELLLRAGFTGKQITELVDATIAKCTTSQP